MNVVEWARSVKADLVRLQQKTGIPAHWAAAQMAHESAVDGGAGLSELALKAHNYAGLKWAEWQRAYGCVPVTYGTWEEVGGQRVDLSDAFCSCPSWEVWLKVYGDLLSGHYYGPSLAYAGDPFLFGWGIWQAGWATDSQYLVGTGHWMAALYAEYKETLPALPSAGEPAVTPETVTIADDHGKKLCEGWLEDSKTVVPLRALTEGLGYTVEWQPDPPMVILKRL
jgi:hypothetical protein